MKLINKISRYFLLVSTLVFAAVSVGLYFVLQNTITEETDEQLLNISQKTIQELKSGKAVSFYPFVEIAPVNHTRIKNEFKNELIRSIDENDLEPFRQLTTSVNVNGKYYKIIVRVSLIEKEDLLFSILTVALAAFLLFVLILYFTNKIISKNILNDFYDTLAIIEKFSLKNPVLIQLNKSKVEEFEKLNQSILFLAEKAQKEYRGLKEFNEEINHELQTPLAVVKSKLELLLQSNNINEAELSIINIALNNLNKLEKTNKSILLLNKLENKDLFENTRISVYEEIKSILESFDDFIKNKNILIETFLEEKLFIYANQSLINILIGNIISNSIKHNTKQGKILITSQLGILTFSNSCLNINHNVAKHFNRFYKDSDSADSVGLGLTIAQKICELYKIEIINKYEDNFYYTILDFNNSRAAK